MRGVQGWVPDMQVGHAPNEQRAIAWWLDLKGVGESLRERYEVPQELPPKLLKLVTKLDAIEGIKRMVEARTIVGIKPFPDWFVLT